MKPVILLTGKSGQIGAELLRLAPNHVDICFAQARKQVTARCGMMLPYPQLWPDSARIETRAEVVRIKVGKQPHGITFSPDSKILYVASGVAAAASVALWFTF